MRFTSVDPEDDERWSVRCQRHEGKVPCTYSSYRRRLETANAAAAHHAWRDHGPEDRPVVVNILLNDRVHSKVRADPLPAPEDDPPPF